MDVPALRKGLIVLELLAAEGPLSMADVQRATGLNKTMTFRLLRVLREQGYVAQDEARHRYGLGPKLLALGHAAATRLDLVAVGQPLLDGLRQRFDETINLGILAGFHVTYVAMAESQRGLRMAANVGTQDYAHATALGKAILAHLPADQQEAYLEGCSWPRVTPKTITDADALRRELARTRDRGFAIDDEENELGARCVGAPILDARRFPIAGISASGPTTRIGGERLDEIAAALWRASHEIARRLGHAPSTTPDAPTANGRAPGVSAPSGRTGDPPP